jgi:hypothetical protein
MTDVAAQLADAQALIGRQDDRITGLLELLAQERAKTAAVLSPASERITLTAIELERFKAAWLAANHSAIPVVLASPMSHCAREALDEARVHAIRDARPIP